MWNWKISLEDKHNERTFVCKMMHLMKFYENHWKRGKGAKFEPESITPIRFCDRGLHFHEISLNLAISIKFH